MDIRIRPYHPADCDAVATLWFDSWKSTGVGSPDASLQDELRQRLPKEIADGWSVHVAIKGEEIVGFVALKADELEQLFVAPDRQRLGIGKQLLDLVKAQRPSGFHLTTATLSQAGWFYEREGLRPGDTATHPRFGHSVTRYDWRP